MWPMILANPLLRKTLGFVLGAVVLYAGWRVQEARISHYRTRAEQAEALVVQYKATNAQFKELVSAQNQAISELQDATIKAKARQALAEAKADKINQEYNEWLLRLRGASVPHDDKGAWAWFLSEYDALNSKFQKTEDSK